MNVAQFLLLCRSFIQGSSKPSYLPERLPQLCSGTELVQNIGSLWVDGYNAALEGDARRVAQQIDSLPPFNRAVMYEGALTALASLDLVDKDPGFNRLRTMFASVPDMLRAGINQAAGGALSQLRMDPPLDLLVTDEFWSWAAMDSFGCHQAYFNWTSSIENVEYPAGVGGLSTKALDQGVGRGIWFLTCANPTMIQNMIDRFPPYRRPELWSGIGIMTGAYGAGSEKELKLMFRYARSYCIYLQQGVAIGTWIRSNYEQVGGQTTSACEIICRAKSSEVLSMVNSFFPAVENDNATRAMFNTWKESVTRSFVTA